MKIYEFKAGWENEDFGKCQLANDDFVTFINKWPPDAVLSSSMWENGWEIYVQPWEFYSKDFNKGEKSYVTTYKRRNL